MSAPGTFQRQKAYFQKQQVESPGRVEVETILVSGNASSLLTQKTKCSLLWSSVSLPCLLPETMQLYVFLLCKNAKPYHQGGFPLDCSGHLVDDGIEEEEDDDDIEDDDDGDVEEDDGDDVEGNS